MSKVISFSISDRYLDKLRSLYPDLTDNLAAKQFLTDQLNAGLDDSLDSSLYESYSEIFNDRPDEDLDDSLDNELDDKLDNTLDDKLDNTLDDATIDKKHGQSIEPAIEPAIKQWLTLKEILGQRRKDWPKSIEGLRRKAIREGWPRRDRENRKEYQIP